jgi:hypothetical protein
MTKTLEESVKLEIADRCFAVESTDTPFLEGMKRIFYHADPTRPADFVFNVGFSGSAPFDVNNFKEGMDGWKRFSTKRYIEGFYRWGGRQADVVLEEKDRGLFPWLFIPLVVSAFYILQRDEGKSARFEHVLFHASGVVRGGSGYLFTGRSGSGKTEIARLSMPEGRVINDELVLVSRDNGSLFIGGGPYKGTLVENDPSVREVLKGIYLLVQDDSVYLRRLRGLEAVKKLVDTVFFDDCFYFLDRLQFRGELMEMASLMLEHVPVYELHFTKDNRFWRCVG